MSIERGESGGQLVEQWEPTNGGKTCSVFWLCEKASWEGKSLIAANYIVAVNQRLIDVSSSLITVCKSP